MDNKVMAVIIVAILATASVSAFAVVKMNDKDDDTEKSICDTWYATYNEYVLFKEKASDMNIVANHYRMMEKKVPLVIDSVSNHEIKGKWGEVTFSGLIHDGFFFFECSDFQFAVEKPDCYVEGRVIGDRILLTATTYGDEEVTAVAYVNYTRQNTVPTDMFIDNINFKRTCTPESREAYYVKNGEIVSFYEEAGVPPAFNVVSSRAMLTIIKLDRQSTTEPEPKQEDVIVLCSQGYDNEGCATAFVSGIRNYEGTDHYFAGSAFMTNDKLTLSFDIEADTTTPSVSSYVYTVDYDHGEVFDKKIEAGDKTVNINFITDGKANKSECKINIQVKNNCALITVMNMSGQKLFSTIGMITNHHIHAVNADIAPGYFIGFYENDKFCIIGTYTADEKETMFHFDLEI